MQINQEYLEQELLKLRAKQEQAMANANAIAGAVQLVEHLLLQLATPEHVSAEVVDLHPNKEA